MDNLKKTKKKKLIIVSSSSSSRKNSTDKVSPDKASTKKRNYVKSGKYSKKKTD